MKLILMSFKVYLRIEKFTNIKNFGVLKLFPEKRKEKKTIVVIMILIILMSASLIASPIVKDAKYLS